MTGLADELESLEKDVSVDLGHVLHPAGGVTENFVYEPVAPWKFVYRTIEGRKSIVQVQVEYEDSEKKRKPSWFINVEGKPYYFTRKPPKEWLFNMPNRQSVQRWVEGGKESLTTEQVWNLNKRYLKIFLDFPHEYEFSVVLLFIQQSWLVEILPVVFYLGVKGEFGGGKSVTGEAVCFVCRHGYLTGNLSPPFVARAIQDQKITLMVDELDSIAGTKDSDLNSIFRQGYRRGLRYSRVNPDTLQSESYLIFSPKLFTVHSNIEEALQTRTVPIHVRETEDPVYPIVNLDKESFSKIIYAENFLWYMDHILSFRDNETHLIGGLTNQGVDYVDIVDQLISESKGEDHTSKMQATLYSRKKTLLRKGQLSQLCQRSGRNIELMYLCFVLSNIIKQPCDDDIRRTFQQKLVEERERTELGYLGVLKDVLSTAWKEKQGKPDYTLEDGLVKISNKELYNRYNQKLKDEHGHGLSPHKFKEYLLEFGFTDALNRKKLRVPLPDDIEPKIRLCNIYTKRVLRKLGLDQETASHEPIMVSVKSWCLGHRNEQSQINLSDLAQYIEQELEQEPQPVIQEAFKQQILMNSPRLGKAVVI